MYLNISHIVMEIFSPMEYGSIVLGLCTISTIFLNVVPMTIIFFMYVDVYY